MCPLRVRTSWPVSASHTFTVLSEAGADEALAVGAEGHAVNHGRVSLEGEDLLAPSSASHTFTVLSSAPLAMRLPSGLKATPVTPPVCPLRERTSARPPSHTFTVSSPRWRCVCRRG